jgi:thioredoxin reductase
LTINSNGQERSMFDRNLPIAVIGAGPVGLAAAAHLHARLETPIVFEAGDVAGYSVRQWSHVPMFSPWEFNVDEQAAALLSAAGWQHPPKDVIPTGGELVAQYLEPLAALPALSPHIHFNARVVGVSRKGYDKVRTEGRGEQPFVIRVREPDGHERCHDVKAVIDTSGTWTSPNPAGADGLPAMNEVKATDRILYGIPDVLGALRSRYAGKTTMVIGGGHSALNALIELAELKQSVPDTKVIWVTRKKNVEEAFGGEAADALPARGALGTQTRALVESGAVQAVSPFRVARIECRPDNTLVVIGDNNGSERHIPTEQIIVATGFRPDFSFLSEIRLSLDHSLESSGTIGPLIDPNLHSCGTVRPHGARELAHAEPDFFIAGMKSYGRAPTFLLATGHEQVRSIVAELVGDHEAARDVRLVLPETGVCRTTPRVQKAQSSSCCGGPAKVNVDSCCVEDEDAKAAGEKGCGRSSQPSELSEAS